jgi:Kef-type K+ transport system membrane component KefB
LFLFVYIASLLNWGDVAMGVVLGVVLIAVRTLSKVACNVAAARLSGITERKGLLTGLALTPMSAFAILLLEQSRLYGFDPAVQVLSVMAAMMLLQELLGPVVTQRTLMAAQETHVTRQP